MSAKIRFKTFFSKILSQETRDIYINVIPVQSAWHIFIFLASIYFIINFIMTPNTLSPIHHDDYHLLSGSFENMRWHIVRPISTNLAYFMGEMGPSFSFSLVNCLTIIVPVMIILFFSRLFNTRFCWYSLLLFSTLCFSHLSAFTHGKYLGLITNLTSHVFGCLTLLFIWDFFKFYKLRMGVLALLTYTFSVFAKEDFLLPPLILLVFLWIEFIKRSEIYLSPQKKRRILSIFTIFTGFFVTIAVVSLIFSFMIIRNPFLEGVVGTATGSAPYAVSMNPLILLTAFGRLTFAFIPMAMVLGLICLVSGWILLPDHRRQLTLVIVIVIILILPYALIPNNIPPYRVFAWLPWIAGLTAVIIQVLVNRFEQQEKRGLFYWLTISFSLIFSCIVLWQSNTSRLMNADWYQRMQSINQSMLTTLRQNRSLIAQQGIVGIVGVEGLSPWSNTDGEYLRKKLFFDNRWIVFVDKASMFFTPDQGDKKNKFVNVKPKNQICEIKDLLVLTFNDQGVGKPMLSQQLCEEKKFLKSP